MRDPLIVIDVPNLSHRNFHALGGVSGFKLPTVYGLLRDLIYVSTRLKSNRFAFCFDSKTSERRKVYAGYQNNREDSPERDKIHEEIDLLREEVLPSIGYTNVFSWEGGEADDIMGALARNKKLGMMVLVSSDSDLHQLLDGGRVTIWKPTTKCEMTEEILLLKYELSPSESILHKALTGCSSDNIRGVEGIGPVRATHFIRDRLEDDSAVKKAIADAEEIVERNKLLIRLPYVNLVKKDFPIEDDEINSDCWDVVAQKYGITNLVGRCPR